MEDRQQTAGGAFLISDTALAAVFTPEDFTEEHHLILGAARSFVNGEIRPHIDQLEAGDRAFMLALLRKCGALGLLGTDVPEAYGGSGLDKVSTTIISEVMGATGSFSAVYGAHCGIATLPIVYFGTEFQKNKYLPLLAAGKWCGAYCLTEANAGSDALNIGTKAVLSEDGAYYLLSGEKLFITNAGWADSFVVYAKVDGKAFTGFIVERAFPGVSIGTEETKMGMRGSSTCPVIFQNARVPKENVMYEIGKGHKIAFNVLNLGRWKLGAMTVGGAKACLGEAVTYAKNRVQFGVPIGSFGMVQSKLADMAVGTYFAESAVYRLAGMFDARLGRMEGDDTKNGAITAEAIENHAAECSIVKVFCSETLDYCADAYVQILGGYGFCAAFPAERYYRDARINRIWEGTNEINRLLIPGTLLRMAKQGRLDIMPAAHAAAGEIPVPVSDAMGEGPLGAETRLLGGLKKVALCLLGVAATKFGRSLSCEQEVLAGIADIMIAVYIGESGILRAEKRLCAGGGTEAAGQVDVVRAFMAEAAPRLSAVAGQVLARVGGDAMGPHLARVAGWTRHPMTDVVALKRRIADTLTAAGCYPF